MHIASAFLLYLCKYLLMAKTSVKVRLPVPTFEQGDGRVHNAFEYCLA